MHRIAVLLLVVLATACASPQPSVPSSDILASPQARAKHWREIMPLEVPVGSNRSELMQWLEERRIEPQRVDGKLSFIVEEVAGDGWTCSVWVVRVKALLEEEKVRGYEVGSEGVCL